MNDTILYIIEAIVLATMIIVGLFYKPKSQS